MNKKLITLHFLNEFLSLAVVGVLLLWLARRIDWWPAYAVIVVWLIWFAATDTILLSSNADFIAERLNPPKDAKKWDRILLGILRLAQLLRYILAGLDQRFDWTGGFPLIVQIVAITVCMLSTALFAWAMDSNIFFSQIFRIQADRNHSVVTTGPYGYVRHPGYAGMILFEFGISTLLASWWVLAAGGLCATLIILRTVLEDRALKDELTGYKDYARQVRYRLLPGIW